MQNASLTPTPMSDPDHLYRRWQALLDERGKLRIRAAANALGVSELELRATQLGRESDDCDAQVTRLHGDWPALIQALPALGEVMALTRNESAVHEKIGHYDAISFSGRFGLVLNHTIDLRLFMAHWAHALAVEEPAIKSDARLASLQFFDASGTAIHKVYLREASERAAYDALVAQFRSDDQRPKLELDPPRPTPTPTPDDAIDVAGFQAAWRALTDTHDFFPLLRRFGVARTQALRLAPEGYAIAVANDAIVRVLETAVASETSIMVFVGSPGCVQIHTGPVARVVPTGPWINVLDPGFNLHLRTDAVAESWIVRKPTADGIVTSLELFDEAGRNIALVFGERKPGIPEREDWRELLAPLLATATAESARES